MAEKKVTKKTEKKESYLKKNAWLKYTEAQKKDIFKFCEGYKNFISTCKTERECVTESIRIAEAAGYIERQTHKFFTQIDEDDI